MTYEPVTVENLVTHQDWALRLARRLVREDGEAEDLVQRTWMAALRRPPASEHGARAWIRKVLLNLARERHRRGKTRERYERAFPKTEGDTPDPLELLSRTEIRKLLSEQLLELAEPYRSAVLQRYYDGLSSVEIARRLGIPAGTVRWRLKVGLDQLRAQLDRRAHGDRSRWVSALLLFAPGGPTDDDASTEAPEGIDPAPALGFFGTTSWIVLACVGVLGLFFLARSLERDSRVRGVHAELGAPPLAHAAEQGPPRFAALVERSALAVEPSSSASAGPEQDGLRILVVDDEGSFVPGARVLVASAGGFETRAQCDAEGRARLVVRPQDPGALGLRPTRGRVSLRALAEGHEASALVHVAPPFTSAHEVRLVVGGPDTRLTGRVLDRLGHGVPHAVVAWFDADKRLDRVLEGDFASPSYLSAATDAEGRFVLANLASSRGNLGCFAPGFAYSSRVLDLREQLPLEIVLERGARVSGTVRWPDGRPAADVLVGCEPLLKSAEWATGLPRYDADWRGFGEATRSDENGRFLLAGVKAGRLRMLWARDERTGLVATTSRMLENDGEEHWDADLAEHVGVRLRLVDEVGQPLPAWVVHLRCPLQTGPWWIRRRATDVEGRLFVTDCPDAELLLDVFAPADVGASYASRLLEPSPEEVLVQVETRATSSISGRLLDPVGEPDLRGSLVFHSVRTTLKTPVQRDEQGNFEQRLPPGRYQLALELDRTTARLAQTKLAPSEHLTLGTLTSPALGSLHLDGSALLGSAEAATSFSIFALTEDGQGVMRVARGTLEGELLLPMFPGRYRVLAFDGSGELPIENVVNVQAHEELRLELRR